MKSLILRDARKTLDHSFQKSNFTSLNSTMTLDVQSQITQKFKTFTRWNYKKQLRKKKKSYSEKVSDEKTDNVDMINALLAFTSVVQKKEQQKKKKNNKNVLVMEELQGIKEQRRERFKKMQNPMHLIQHYMSKQGFKPNEEENILLDRIIKLKQFMDQNQPIDLDLVLQKIYKIMNISVDLNQMRFLILSVLLAAEIAYESKQMVRSFHFYTQAMIATTCARMNTIKIECFIQMGKIALELLQYNYAIKFFKKALQYSWKMKDTQSELRLYDWLGQTYYYEGQAGYALYYHNRYIQGELQDSDSATRRISFEMLSEYEKTLQNTETSNIDQLFIEYLTLPIANFDVFPPTVVKKPKPNYSNNSSPRKTKQFKNFGADDLPSVKIQMSRILDNFPQFKTQIPNPDIQRNFVSINKYGRPRKQIDFEQSNDYHKIVGISLKKIQPEVFKLPIDQRIQKALNEKRNPNWWEDMVTRTKKQRQQRLGNLRDKVKKTHLSYHKYPEERRRSQSLKQQKIKESINKTLLNWIDPKKDQFL